MWRLTFFLFVTVLFVRCGGSGNSRVETPKPKASRHSAAFNKDVDHLMNSYHHLTEAFVQWDSVAADQFAMMLGLQLDSLELAYRDGDLIPAVQIHLNKARTFASQLQHEKNITSKRHQLTGLTKELYDILDAVQYDDKKVYLQVCPMAFNDVDSGFWLSPATEIRNPYMGLHHPYYKSGMIGCGETLDSISIKR